MISLSFLSGAVDVYVCSGVVVVVVVKSPVVAADLYHHPSHPFQLLTQYISASCEIITLCLCKVVALDYTNSPRCCTLHKIC